MFDCLGVFARSAANAAVRSDSENLTKPQEIFLAVFDPSLYCEIQKACKSNLQLAKEHSLSSIVRDMVRTTRDFSTDVVRSMSVMNKCEAGYTELEYSYALIGQQFGTNLQQLIYKALSMKEVQFIPVSVNVIRKRVSCIALSINECCDSSRPEKRIPLNICCNILITEAGLDMNVTVDGKLHRSFSANEAKHGVQRASSFCMEKTIR